MSPQIIALFSAIFYASNSISALLGLQYSTHFTATLVAMVVRTVTLWTAVFVTGGIPGVEFLPVLLFVLLGIVQSATSLLSYSGISKIGAFRSQLASRLECVGLTGGQVTVPRRGQ